MFVAETSWAHWEGRLTPKLPYGQPRKSGLSALSGLGGLGGFLEKPLKPLKSCLKNRSKTAHFLRWYLNVFSSKIWAVFERFLSVLPGSRSQTHVHTFATEKLRRDFRDLGGNGATQKTTARPFGQRDQNVHFQDFLDRGGDGASLQTEAETVRPRLYRRIRCTVATMDTCGLRYVSLSQEFQKHELECRVFSIHCGA